MEIALEELISSRQDKLVFYSPYSFIKEIKAQDQFDLFVKGALEKFGASETCLRLAVTVDDESFVFLYEYLSWDSEYFKRDCYRLYTVLYAKQNASLLIRAVSIFKSKLQDVEKWYCFAEIPAEDIFLIQCLNQAGFKLVETRLHYYKSNFSDFEGERYPVRKATSTDMAELARVAASNRNSFDRLHADYAFSDLEADEYLATYAEEAVKGFCDAVFVPNVPNLPVASFIAFNHINKAFLNLHLNLIRVSLVAVDSENRGWFTKLFSEIVHHAKEHNVSYIEYPTQSTNKAVIRTCEKFSFSLGATSHIVTLCS